MNENMGMELVAPQIVPVLDQDFRPAVLANRLFRKKVAESGEAVPVTIALEQSDGSVFHFNTEVFPDSHSASDGNYIYIERIIKFLLWSRGGGKVYVGGPESLGKKIQAHYKEDKTGQFDAEIMGQKIYDTTFKVVSTDIDSIPAANEKTAPLGRHLEGNRIGFDLGASDRKCAAIKDGETVFSEEVVWDPVVQNDPQWHFDEIMDSIKRAAKHLPKVDAIGGSSAGVYVNNHVKVASLFRGVSRELFETRVKDLFFEVKKAWNDVPFELVNDGEVTALAGSMSINDNAVLGIAMGSSEAVGYVNEQGNITSWLNELAFAPVDYNPNAAVDEWSGDYGCGCQYFSQQCVARLVGVAGIDVEADMPFPEILKHVQKLMEEGDERAEKIYKTIGTYLGYAIAHYADFYAIRNVLILGRVTTGKGGSIILDGAKKVLNEVFPELSETITFHIPSEKDKRHGQAMAAASLPVV